MKIPAAYIYRIFKIALFFFCLMSLSACVDKHSKEVKTTQIAGDIFATQTALIPTSTRTPTATTTSTPTSSPTPKPSPMGWIKSETLELYEGPSLAHPVIKEIPTNTEFEINGQYQDCSWINIKDEDDNEGWILGHVSYIDMNCDCNDIPLVSFRPINGTLIFDNRIRNGSGEMIIINGSAFDQLVILAEVDNDPLLAIYVQKEDQFTLTKIPDKIYEVYFTSGTKWMGKQQMFSKNSQFRKFEDTVDFSAPAGQYMTWEITLHEVEGGNAPTEPLNVDEFPKLVEE